MKRIHITLCLVAGLLCCSALSAFAGEKMSRKETTKALKEANTTFINANRQLLKFLSAAEASDFHAGSDAMSKAAAHYARILADGEGLDELTKIEVELHHTLASGFQNNLDVEKSTSGKGVLERTLAESPADRVIDVDAMGRRYTVSKANKDFAESLANNLR